MTRDRTQRLGRGLAALLGEPPSDLNPSGVQDIAVDHLEPNPLQPRGAIDPASLDDLVASIREHGLLQPLLVRRAAMAPNRYQIVAGERRWRAAITAGLTSLPCLVQTMDDQQSAVAALVENLQRLDLNPIEEAQGYERLVAQFGLTQERLADVVGKSRSHVTNTLRLLRLPPPVQQMVRLGTLSAGHARTLLSHPAPVEAAQHIIDRNLSVRQAEALADRAGTIAMDPDDEARDPNIRAVETDLADQLGMAVRVRATGGRGSLTIRFSRLEQLDILIARLSDRSFPS
jgi:ParB family chromosome partitioning protein